MDDSKIVDLYLSRDESAVSQTAEQYGARLRGIATRILDDPSAAEECENDTYLQAFTNLNYYYTSGKTFVISFANSQR